LLGGGNNLTDSLYQQVAIPQGATNMTITGYVAISTQEAAGGSVYDVATLEIHSSSGGYLATVGTWSNQNATTGWTAMSFLPAGSYAGQTIRLRFDTTNDYSLDTYFFFDTLGLRVTTCQ
jgi:hypothetical protein